MFVIVSDFGGVILEWEEISWVVSAICDELILELILDVVINLVMLMWNVILTA